MGSENSKSREPTMEESCHERMKQYVAKHGVADIDSFFWKVAKEWKDVTLNFAVMGTSGSGKSTFINRIRGLEDYDKGAAKVNVKEETKVSTSYTHPDNLNIIFWDLPGVGAQYYPDVDTYAEKLQFDTYDAFLIFAQKRFTVNDLKMAEKVKSLGKPFFFVRTHISGDCKNEERSQGPNFNLEDTMETIRQDCFKNLKELLTSDTDIFLIDNQEKHKWDFDRLIDAINEVLPERRKEAFVLSLSNLTKQCLKRKANMLRVRAVIFASVLAGLVEADPEVERWLSVNLVLLEILQYHRQFGIPSQDSTKFDQLNEDTKRAILKNIFEDATQFCSSMVDKEMKGLVPQQIAKYIPEAGKIVAVIATLRFVSYRLIRCINELEKIALEIFDMGNEVVTIND